MKTVTRSRLQIPLQIIQFVQREKLVKPFAVYVYLKYYSSGKVKDNSKLFDDLQNDLCIKDKRTLKKHLTKLQQLNWVGYNAESGYYFIRGFGFVRCNNDFRSRTAVTFHSEYFRDFRSFLVAAIIGEQIKKQKFYKEVAEPRKLKTAAKKEHAAKQPCAFSGTSMQYYGLSNKRIAELVGCKYTRASVLKRQAANANFIRVRHRFKEIGNIKKADFLLGNILRDMDLDGHKIRIVRDTKSPDSIKILVQQMDEIEPLIKFKTIEKFANIDDAAKK